MEILVCVKRVPDSAENEIGVGPRLGVRQNQGAEQARVLGGGLAAASDLVAAHTQNPQP